MATLRHLTALMCVFFGTIYIQGTTARPLADSNDGGWEYSDNSLLSADVDVGLGTDLYSSFYDVLYQQLLQNNDFALVFNGQENSDLAANIGSAVGQAFAAEFYLDVSTATGIFMDAMSYVYPGSGVEAYANALANASVQLLRENNFLNEYNSFSIANTIANVITGSFSSAMGASNNLDVGFDWYDNGAANFGTGENFGAGLNTGDSLSVSFNTRERTGINAGIGAGVNTGLGLGAELNSGLGIGAGLGAELNTGLGLGAGLNAGQGTGLNAGLGAGLNAGLITGLNAGLGAGLNAGLGAGLNAGLGTGLNAGLGAGLNTDLGARLNAGLGAGLTTGLGLGSRLNTGLGIRSGFNAGLDSNVRTGLGLGAGLNTGLGLGSRLNAGLGLNAGQGLNDGVGLGLNSGLGFNAGLGLGLGAGANDGAGLGVGLNIGSGGDGTNISKPLTREEAMGLFKQRLVGDLLKDKYFRNVFSDSIPAAPVSSLVSVIAQFLSKAFSVPRSSLLTLENDLKMLIKNDLTSPAAYAEGISISFTNFLAAANILLPSAIGVQVGMASKAITSAVLSFLETYKVAGVGLGVDSNPYNSYFSILSGLEMLPYVGPDAVSRKYPPILKAAKASNFGSKFSRVLYSNLVSSSKFSEGFLLGIPAQWWKQIAKTLGKFTAEAFGSPNQSFFTDIYANALLSVGEKLSYKTYARVLSAATSKALYALGYFVSGNPNIQAAIASNAIIRAIVSNSRSEYRKDFPPMVSSLGLSGMTPLAGVPPPLLTSSDSGSNGKVGLNVGAGLGVGADVGAGVGIDVNAVLGLGLAANADLGLGLDVNANVQPNLYTDVNAGVGLFGGDRNSQRRNRRDLFDAKGSLDIGANVDANVEAAVDVGAAANIGVGADIGANVGLGLGADLTTGLGADVGLGLGVGGRGSGASTGRNSQAQVRSNLILSIADVLPQLLSEKMFSSTAMYTAMSLVGSRKVANLIAQGIASQFGFLSASTFANSYELSLANLPDSNYGPSMAAIARATTDALATAGILNMGFNVQTADQLSTAIVAKYSSLIATSLDSKDWNVGAKWTNINDQDFVDPPLSRGYSYLRPNALSYFVRSYDDTMLMDYNLGNSVSRYTYARNGIPRL